MVYFRGFSSSPCAQDKNATVIKKHLNDLNRDFPVAYNSMCFQDTGDVNANLGLMI